MIFTQPLSFIREFVEELDRGIRACTPNRKLSTVQRCWLSFCLMGILLSNQVCWAAFERVGLGGYSQAALSWMFRHSKLLWPLLLHVSILLMLNKYNITEGQLVGDDSERQRAKVTKRIFATSTIFDKKSGGWFKGQTVVLLFLVTAKVSLPVGFRFYQPDPAVAAWKTTDDTLKKQGVKQSERPPKPEPNAAYPSKLDLLLDLLREFQGYHPDFQVKAILADALYGSAAWMNQAASLFPKTPVLSQLKKTQKVRCRQREMTVAQYCATHPGVEVSLRIRGGQTVQVVLGSARLYVSAHQQKRLVVALKYPGAEAYRYRVATDMRWRAVDVASAYPLRWLVEVFFEDWKLDEGWGQLAPPWDEEGSSRGLTLSLLLDHALLLHPRQRARIENNLPACTVGSLQQHSRMEALIEVIRGIVEAADPHQQLDEIITVAKRLFPLRDSAKHMNGRDVGRLEPTPSLKYRAAACMA
ncbi:MAG: transposase [Candidatus Competibacteraceae bacterium]